jgi:hypothetical protein
MNQTNKLYQITREVFYFLGLGLIIFILMEIIKPRIVLGYLNLTVWFVLWLLSGIIILVMNKGGDKNSD